MAFALRTSAMKGDPGGRSWEATVAKQPRGGVRYATAPVPFPRDRDPGVSSSSVCVDLGATEGAAAWRQPGAHRCALHTPDTQYEESGAPDGSLSRLKRLGKTSGHSAGVPRPNAWRRVR